MRRLTALLGVLALALTIAPGELATNALDCCTGTMCPMHSPASQAATCDMSQHGSAELKPCPVQITAHYTGAVVFVLPAPTVLDSDLHSEPAIAYFQHFTPEAELRVESPPPRLLQTA